MRVCFVTGEYPPMEGGVGDYTKQLAEALTPLGIEAYIVTSWAADPSRMQGRVKKPAPTGPLLLPIVRRWNFAAWRWVEAVVKRSGCDIVHLQYQAAAFGLHAAVNLMPWWLHRRTRAGFVTTMHDLRVPYLFPKAGPLRPWANRFLVNHSNAVVATNPEDYHELLGVLPGPDTLHLIPIGSNLPGTPPKGYDRGRLRAKLGVAEGEFLLSYFGFLNRSKGVEHLLEAVKILRDKGLEVRLIMVGATTGYSDQTNRAYRREVLAFAKSIGLGDAVLWPGFLPPAEASAHLLASDACVLPFLDGASFRRGTLVAALAHGLPTITTEPAYTGEHAGALPRLVSEENCLLAPPGNSAAIASAVERLMSSADLRDRLRQETRKLSQSFAWKGIAEKHLEVYRKLLAI